MFGCIEQSNGKYSDFILKSVVRGPIIHVNVFLCAVFSSLFRTGMLSAVADAFEQLSNEARELYLDENVPVIPRPPRALDFLRDWVMPNKPVVFKNALNHWKALKLWKDYSYLR